MRNGITLCSCVGGHEPKNFCWHRSAQKEKEQLLWRAIFFHICQEETPCLRQKQYGTDGSTSLRLFTRGFTDTQMCSRYTHLFRNAPIPPSLTNWFRPAAATDPGVSSYVRTRSRCGRLASIHSAIWIPRGFIRCSR
eukprot:GEMP01076902.1.p2 GENE.GEMP01076902.1~~GEMP01076902.1.p2  ORF type:complete len:137 (-),score=16.62 GEMP01076902.1:583-993(-)